VLGQGLALVSLVAQALGVPNSAIGDGAHEMQALTEALQPGTETRAREEPVDSQPCWTRSGLAG
jgi:hypothetical protein